MTELQIRLNAALYHWLQPLPSQPINGDEALYPNRIDNFSKTLPHNALGEVDPPAYQALLNALASADPVAFERIPLGGKVKLANPQAAYAFDLEGRDSHALAIPAPPAFGSADGLSLTPYEGDSLTVGGELNKLAANIALGRDMAGIHWRSDGIQGLLLGERVAIEVLRDFKDTCNEPAVEFSLTRFNGANLVIRG